MTEETTQRDPRVTQVLVAARGAEARDRTPTRNRSARADRGRIAAARRALRAYEPYAPAAGRRANPAA